MSTLFVFLLVLGVSCVAIATDELKYMSMRGSWKSWKPVNASAPPKRCCIPGQWEGQMRGFVSWKKDLLFGLLGSANDVVYDAIDISYDASNKRYAATSRISKEGTEIITYKVIGLFAKGRIYVIDGQGKCRTHALRAQFKPICIDERDRFLAHYVQGLGDEMIEANAWILENPGYNVIYFVTAKQCIPLADTFWGKSEGLTSWGTSVPFVGTLSYIDITTGIKDNTVFMPPNDCMEYNGNLYDHLDGMTKYIFSKTGGLPI